MPEESGRELALCNPQASQLRVGNGPTFRVVIMEYCNLRCRLSASPATGLVGMQENAFLSDYFACLGFLPLASAR